MPIWDDAILYAAALWGNARWLLTGSFYFADNVLKRLFPDTSAKIDKQIKASTRRRIEIVIFILACLWATFQIWRDEHHIRLAAEGQGKENRHLSDSEKRAIKTAFEGHEKEIPILLITSIGNSEAVHYAHEFQEIFLGLKYNVILQPGYYSFHEADTGLMVGVSDIDNPAKEASIFISLMLKSGLRFKQIQFGGGGLPPPGSFDLFIGER